jgi:hypothetical protein
MISKSAEFLPLGRVQLKLRIASAIDRRLGGRQRRARPLAGDRIGRNGIGDDHYPTG